MTSSIELFIKPGEWEFAGSEFRIRTTLGSCVAIVLWHPRRKVGGMCHYMLPSRKIRSGGLSAKYADEALELMLEEVRRRGTRPQEYDVKLFGGGNMFPSYQNHSSSVSVHNVAAVRSLIASAGLSVTAESLGGNGYRNLIFDIGSGYVWVRHFTTPVA